MSALAADSDTLLISDDFFGYAKEIKRALEARGRKVLWFPDRYSSSTAAKFTLRVLPVLARSNSRTHFESILRMVRRTDIRDVLVIKGESITIEMFDRLRKAMPQTRFTLYFWDSYRNMPPGSERKVDFFDSTFSFDPIDVARDPRLTFRPLFFIDDYQRIDSSKTDIDVLFVGTAHSDRYAVLSRLEKALPAQIKMKKVMYFPSRTFFRAKRALNPSLWRAQENEFVFDSLSKAEVMALVARSRIVVDIERTIQTGLTMRTMEMLGASKKLITTNSIAREAEFFHPDNVCVIDRHDPELDSSFMSKPYRPVPGSTLKRYSLSGWIDEVLP